MKTVFNSSELAHVWAHQTQDEGHSSSMSFRGSRLYSYGTCIAEFVTIREQRFVVVSSSSYSSTTNKHQSHMHSAISHKEKIYVEGDRGQPSLVPCYVRDGKAGMNKWGRELIKNCIADSARFLVSSEKRRVASTRDRDLAAAARALDDAKRLKEIFALRVIIPENAEGIAEAQKRVAKREAAAERKRQKARDKQLEEDVVKWLAGDGYTLYGLSRILFRVLEDDGSKMIETSKGARVPYAEGEKAFRFAIARKTKGWHRNGEQFMLGNYHLNVINNVGVVAGCHAMKWPEIEAFAKEQGWTK